MAEAPTTAVVQRYLGQLAGASGDESAERIIRELLSGSVRRLHVLCLTLLRRDYPRLARPPMNLRAEEMLSGVVERMMKALRKVRPGTVREFFALANQHMRWELNELARRLDHEAQMMELRDSDAPSPASLESSQLSQNAARMMQAIEALPEEEREAFCLVRIQGMTQTDAAEVLGVNVRTIQRRLAKTVPLLAMQLRDLQPDLRPQDNASWPAPP